MELVVVSLGFTGSTPAKLAEAFMQRDETATVWIRPQGQTSRVVFDIESADAEATARALVDEIATANGATAEVFTVTVGTDRDRLANFDQV